MPENCPSCRQPLSASAAECAACGLILAKWRARSEAVSLGSAAREVQALKSEGPSPLTIGSTLLIVFGLIGWYARNSVPIPAAQAAPRKSLGFTWPPMVGQPYPDLQLLDQNGHGVALSSFKGRLIVLEPVGMTCEACNAYSGANRPGIGPFEGQPAQADLSSVEEFFPQYTDGVQYRRRSARVRAATPLQHEDENTHGR